VGVKVGVANFLLGQSIGIDELWALKWAWQTFFPSVSIKGGVANLSQSIGIDENNTFHQSIGIDENITFQSDRY